MMSNWQPGDRAIITDSARTAESHLRRYRGTTVTLEAPAGVGWWYVFADGFPFKAKESVLRKPYDPLEPGSWEDMKDIWTPKELEVVA